MTDLNVSIKCPPGKDVYIMIWASAKRGKSTYPTVFSNLLAVASSREEAAAMAVADQNNRYPASQGWVHATPLAVLLQPALDALKLKGTDDPLVSLN